MSRGSLRIERDNDTRKSKEELLDELEVLRRQLASFKETQARCELVEGELRNQKAILSILREIPEPILIVDAEPRVIYANFAAADLFNVNPERIQGKTLWEIYPKSEDTIFFKTYTKVVADRVQACFREKHRGTGKRFEISMYPGAGSTIIFFHDITTEWHKEEIRRLALVLLHSLKENIFLMRADGRIFHANDETRTSLGYSTHELSQLTIFDLVPYDHSIEWHDALTRIRHRGSMTFESKLRTRDGREFPVEVYANYLQLYGFDYYIVSARDIAERKEIERKLAESRSEADASKEQTELYLDLMGHDIKNLNMLAMGSLEIAISNLEQGCTLKPEDKALLDRSLESLENSSELISNVQKLQRASTEEQKLQPMDMTSVLKETVGRFREARETKVKIDFSSSGACMVNADELLKDVFTNIIGNAIKHAIEGQSLTIRITTESIVENGRKYCRTIIEDNGPGIPDEIKTRLFKRYVRGKTRAKGSGLGLYLVRTLLDHYRGSIQVEDRVPGDHTQGAKFVIIIPSVSDA